MTKTSFMSKGIPRPEYFFNERFINELPGIVTALISQGYEAVHAAILGVYLHGYAGDAAARALSQEAMVATDLIAFLPQAFLKLY